MIRRLALDLLAPAVCGGLVTLGFSPFGYWPLTLVAIAGLIALWWNTPAPRAAGRGFVFGLAYFGTGVWWPYVSIHEYGHAPAALAAVLTALLVAYMALYPTLVGAFAGATRRLPRPLWALVLVPGAWLLSELVRAYLGTGFPWLSLGYTLIDSPASALAPIVGVYGVGLALVVAAGALCLLVAGSLIARVLAVLLIALTPVVIWVMPAPAYWTEPTGKTLSVAIAQGNFGIEVKSKPGMLDTTLTRYMRLTANLDAEVVLWPETAIPVPVDRVRPFLNKLDALGEEKNQAILTGALVPHGSNYYNAVIALGVASGQYYKRHLVPFGEYFPVPDFLKDWMNAINMRFGRLAFGPQQQAVMHVDGVTLGVSICFEDVFPREIALSLPEAGVLVNVTNDAWFKGTIALAQHLQIARMRSLEAGRPMLRAANTGISAIIDYTGDVQSATEADEVEVLTGRVWPRQGVTPYVAMGNVPLWWASGVAVLLGLIGALGVGWRRRRD